MLNRKKKWENQHNQQPPESDTKDCGVTPRKPKQEWANSFNKPQNTDEDKNATDFETKISKWQSDDDGKSVKQNKI